MLLLQKASQREPLDLLSQIDFRAKKSRILFKVQFLLRTHFFPFAIKKKEGFSVCFCKSDFNTRIEKKRKKEKNDQKREEERERERESERESGSFVRFDGDGEDRKGGERRRERETETERERKRDGDDGVFRVDLWSFVCPPPTHTCWVTFS